MVSQAIPGARPLGAGDTEAARVMLERRPIQNVLLLHVLRAGVLGRLPGFFGCEVAGTLRAMLMIGVQGGASLEVCHPDAYSPLADCAAEQVVKPRHITGAEDVTLPFWQEYSKRVRYSLQWERREHVYVVERGEGSPPTGVLRGLRRARETELFQVVENSAQQHIEDLGEDRFSQDPAGFRARHLSEIRNGHWWVVVERGEVVFQVHVGPRTTEVVQLGGVFTPRERRGRGYATRGLQGLVARLHRDLPRVSLYCDESNRVACRLYERVGFRLRFYNRSYLLRDPAEGAYT